MAGAPKQSCHMLRPLLLVLLLLYRHKGLCAHRRVNRELHRVGDALEGDAVGARPVERRQHVTRRRGLGALGGATAATLWR